MIFCTDEIKARRNCEKEQLSNVVVNASEQILENFLHFLSLDPKTPNPSVQENNWGGCIVQ
jgi:hypothetical protein